MRRIFGNLRFSALALSAWLCAAPSLAFESEWRGVPEGEVRLIAAQSGFGEDGRVLLGLQFRIREGWKTYWRFAGESGSPPIFDWQKSRNLKTVAVKWPAPVRFNAFGYDSFGYAGMFVLPVEAVRERAGQAMSVRLQIFYQVCENICLPVEADLALTIPDGAAAGTQHQFTIADFQDRVPRPAAAAAFTVDSVVLGEAGGKPILRVALHCRNGQLFDSPDLMVEGPVMFGFGRPENTLSQDGCKLDMVLPVYADAALERLRGAVVTLTVIDQENAGEFTATVK